jgi:hypothetical protein
MSYLSDKTGRPKEEGGHKRLNVSLDLYTRDVLDSVENVSQLIEYCVRTFIKPKWVAYHEPNVTVNYSSSTFVEGAAFEFTPCFNPSNAVLRMNCYFDFASENGAVAFRVSVNGKKGLRLVEHSSKSGYSCSCVYDEKEMGFENTREVFCNQDRYIFKFEFKSLKPEYTASVKDIMFVVEVVENPLPNVFYDFSSRSPKLK